MLTTPGKNLVSLAGCLALLVGCMSGPTSGLFVAFMDMSLLFYDLATTTNAVYGNQTGDLPLPDYYYIGLSGVCLSTNGTLLPCRRHFAQTPAVLDLIITDVNGTDSVQWRKWDSFLNQANYIMATNQSFYDSSSKAAAAFMLLSFFFNVATIAFTITTRFSYPSFSLLLDIIDLVFVIISSVLWTLMFVLATLDQEANDNITLSISQPFKMGPAYIVLWAICLAKILVVPSAAVWILKCCGRAAKNMAKESYRIADDVTAETADGLFSATTGFMVREVIG